MGVRAPGHLSPEAASLYRRVLRDHVAILTAACEALDRMRKAQAAIAKDGEYTPGRFGLKAHPAIAVERDSRTALLRAIRELGLDLEAPARSRPPSQWR